MVLKIRNQDFGPCLRTRGGVSYLILSYPVSYLMFQMKKIVSLSLSYLTIATDKRYKIQDKIKVLTFWHFSSNLKMHSIFFEISNCASFTTPQKVKKIPFHIPEWQLPVNLDLAESHAKISFSSFPFQKSPKFILSNSFGGLLYLYLYLI